MVTQEQARWSRKSAETDTAAYFLQLAQIHTAEGRMEQAEETCTEALRRKEQSGERDRELAAILNLRATVLLERGAAAEARQAATNAIYALAGIPHSDRERVQALSLAGRSYIAEERYAEARPLLERALAMCRHSGSAEESQMLLELGDLYRHSGSADEAEQYYRMSLAIAEKVHGVYSPEVGTVCHRLAALAESADDPGAFERYARRAYEIRCSTFGSTHPLTAAAQSGLASVLEACGEIREAGEKYLHALAIFDRQYANASFDGCSANVAILRDYAFCRIGACRKLLSDGRTEDAHEFSARAQRVFERFLGKRHPLVKQCRKEHESLLRMGKKGLGHRMRYSAWEWWRSL